ncbi:MAG TPA: hypothetical protein PKH46_07160, partial [Candidatus Cryosericum sp.]|nr:hypothetical protein [Candidatus Cryosericum sp.]
NCEEHGTILAWQGKYASRNATVSPRRSGHARATRGQTPVLELGSLPCTIPPSGDAIGTMR